MRLERTAFVGREHERSLLSRLLDEVETGRGSLVMIGGEPGVGKTRLAREIIGEAQERGFACAVGHCYETDTAPPYLPFIEALDATIGSMEPEAVLDTLGDAAPEVAKLLPDLRLRFDIPAPLQLSPEEERFRLLNSVRDCFGRLGEHRALLLVLEDLHWADDSSLFLLQHLGRLVAEMPLLLLATYRDTELDVGRPLARTLEELLRNRTALRISLSRLPGDEVAALLQALSGHEPPVSLVEVLYRETEGNPFFLEEVYQHLSEEGRLVDADGRWRDGLSISEEDVPEGVRLAIGRRLERVSDRCRQVLSAAATAGTTTSLTLLQDVLEIDEDALLSAIEEAERLHLASVSLEAGDERLVFAHELIRQTLLAGLSLPRRRRLHVRIAHGLESRYAAHLDEHASRLAEHLAHSSDPADLDRAVDYYERAAHHATSIYAWTEAVRLLDRALDLQGSSNPEEKSRRCDLLLRLCDSLLAADQPVRVIMEVSEEAYDLAEDLADDVRASAVCQIRWISTFSLGATVSPEGYGRNSQTWIERTRRLAVQGTVFGVYADVASSWRGTGNALADYALAAKALVTARELGDPEAFYVAAIAVLGVMPPGTEQACLEVATEIALSPRIGVRARTLAQALEFAARALLAWGERDLAARIGQELADRAAATGESTALRAGYVRLALAAIDGRLEEAVAEADRLATAETGMLAWSTGFRPLLLLGTPEHLRQAEELIPRLEGGLKATLDRLLRAHLGTLPPPSPPPPGWDPVTSRMVHYFNTIHLEVAVLADRPEYARTFLKRLEPAASPATADAFTLIDRHRGAAYMLLGEPERAKERYLAALAAGEKMRFRPEVALTRLALAELLLDHPSLGEGRAEAFEHLESCIPEFRAMKMQPSLQKAEALLTGRGRQRPRPPVYPDGLSAREVEILRLVAQGLTNQQIAQELTISLNTVLHHVTNILGKTGTANRTEATDYAHRQSLIG